MDHTGGMVIVEVKSVEEVVEIAKNDPAVLEINSIMKYILGRYLAEIFN
ncbi:hypothetical protein ETC01_15895 [Geobacillus sp. NFOSA3]|nr:YciI family protein [Geobacillus sp. BMUD]NNU84764.1 hypothetical protein [Geobacillus sp. BMUD]NNU94623.1 hypothetical protein [Geobacillus sp. NFOSA3]